MESVGAGGVEESAGLGRRERPEAHVEKVADPKAVLKAALGGRRDAERDFGRLGQTVALDALSKVPAYRRWTAELRRAMEGLRFL
ncbi:hypothetical protein GCM10010340_21150 [Streptomyces griseoloalbus]|nr:hypothetical protein GCM10010340_21150 [Streptomyces albaduncus]